MTDVTPPPAPATTPIWEDLVDVLTSPTAVFQRRKEDPTFAIPLLILTAVFALLIFASWDLFEPVRRADGVRQIETMVRMNPNLPAERAEEMRAAASAGGSSMGRYLTGLVIPLGVIFIGLFTWVGGKAVGAKTTMGQAFMIATYAQVPKIIGMLIAVVLTLVLPEAMLDGQFRLSVGPGMLLDPDTMRQSFILALARLDLTTLWVTVLLALGLKATGNVPTGRAIAAGALIWILGGLFPVGAMFLGEMAMGIK